MHSIDPPVSNALILVCEKCGKRLDSDGGGNLSRQLVSRLKKLAKKRFGKGAVRAVATSCMDICPDDRISVALIEFGGATRNTRFFAVSGRDPDDMGERILRELKGNQ